MTRFFPKLHPNVWILMFAQSLVGSIGPLVVFVGGFIGLELAPTQTLATLPIACLIIGMAAFTLPVVKLISIIGRKLGFQLALSLGTLNCGLSVYAISTNSFWLFCLNIFIFGATMAATQQFRFAAIESVDISKASQAVSVLLMAGLIAAFLGPEAALFGKDLFALPYAGSFSLLGGLLVLAIVVVSFYRPIERVTKEAVGPARSLNEIIKQPIFITALLSAAVGFSVMSFVMTATPISMHVHNGFDMADTKWVIQSHIIGMYLPSLFTGKLIHKFGFVKILYAGIAAFLLCMAIGLAGQHYMHYWWSLVLLGIGWNFMFVSATALLPMSYKETEKFKVQGFNDFIIFSSQATASLSAGLVIKTFGWNSMLMITIPLLVITFCVIWLWRHHAHQAQSLQNQHSS